MTCPGGMGDGRRAMGDGVVGVVVGDVATRPRRRAAGAVLGSTIMILVLVTFS